MTHHIELRTSVAASDREHVRNIVAATGMFHAPEVDVAVELVDDRLAKGEASDYSFVFADEHGETRGYACYGFNTMTQSSWELYWIAVDPLHQNKHIGRRLLEFVEADIASRGGGQLFVETSGRAAYAPTRRFYLGRGYAIAAELSDFYAPGDSKVIFVRSL